MGTWSKIWKRLANFDPSITDSSFRLKKNYERYLLDYEFHCHPEHRHQSAGDSERHRKSGNASRMPMLRHVVSSPDLLASSGNFGSPSPNNSPSINNLLNPVASGKKESLVSSMPTLTKTASSPSLVRVAQLSISESPSSPLSASEDVLPPVARTRRQKRKAEPVPLRPIPRDTDGSPVMPLDFGDFVLESLGTIVPRAPYVTDKHIWPVGYRISRAFRSMNNPDTSVRYTCSIVDAGDKPLFVILAEDESKSIQSHSPSAAWKTIFSRVCEKTGEELPPRKIINGTGRFGLLNPHVIHLIKEQADCIFSSPSTNSSSPFSSLRKRKARLEDSSSATTKTKYGGEIAIKFPRVEKIDGSDPDCNEEIIFHSQEELDDLEIAVATLTALKFCSVY